MHRHRQKPAPPPQTTRPNLGPLAKTVWPCLVFEDCLGSIDFLVRAFGFVSTATYALEDEPTVVEHAELRWPEGGGIMCGSPGRDDSEFSKQPSGSGSLYVVTDHPDELCRPHPLAAGGELVRNLHD